MRKVLRFINDSTKILTFSNKTNISTKTGSTIIGTTGLILCANTPGTDDGHEAFPIICDKVIEHIWRVFSPFLHAELSGILDVVGMPPFSLQITGFSWDLSLETNAEHGCCFY